MLDTIFLITAIIGGTVMVCQFLLTLLGMGDHGGDFADGAADVGDVSGDVPDLDVDVLGDHHTPLTHAADADYQHTDGSWLFGVLSFRTLIAAAAFFGITGKAALSAGYPNLMSLVLASLVGVGAMYAMYFLMRAISRFTSSGNQQIALSPGKTGRVYIPVPAARAGAGKIQLSLQNRTVEYQAVTADEKPLETGEAVEVVCVTGSDTVEVRRLQATADA